MSYFDLGTIGIGVTVDSASALRQVQDFGNQCETIGNKMTSIGAKMSLALTTPLTLIAKKMIDAASDYNESLSKVEVTFEDNAQVIKDWAKTSIEQMGLASGTALESVSLFGDMGKAMGLTSEQTLEYSMNLVQLSADLASYKNISQEVAQTALKGVYTGEGESLKMLGIVMQESTLEAYRLAQGIKVKYSEMTQAEKVQLRYAYVMSQTTDAQGDFARTSDGTANSMRMLQESVKELYTTFGQELLPVVTPIIQDVTKLVNKFGELDEETKKNIVTYAALAMAIGPVTTAVGGMITGVSKLIPLTLNLSSSVGVLLSNPVTASLAAIVGLLGTCAVAIKNVNDEQKALNEQLEESIKLSKDVTGANEEEVKELQNKIGVITQSLRQYDSLTQKINEYEAANGDLAGAYRDLSGYTKEQLEQLEKQGIAYDDNVAHLQALQNQIEDEYGSIENAITIRDNYNQRLKNSEEAQKTLETAVNDEAKAIIEEGLSMQSTMNYAQYLVDKKKALESQSKLSAAQEKELIKVNESLQDVLGDSIIAWDSDTQTMSVNAAACEQMINYQNGVANSKISQANTIALEAAKIKAASADECETIIENCLTEIEAFDARAAALDESFGLGEQLAEQSDRLHYKMRLAKQRLSELESQTGLNADAFKGLGSEADSASKKTTKASEDMLQKAQELYTQESELGKLTHNQKIARLDEMVQKYQDTAAHQIESRSFARDEILTIISELKENEALTLDEEIAMYDEAKEKYCLNERDKADFTESINDAIIEDVSTLVSDLSLLSDEQLQDTKELILAKKEKYKDYKTAVKEIEKDITLIVKEETDRQYEATKENVDRMKSKYAEIYSDTIDEIDEQTNAQVDAIQAQIDAIEEAQTARELARKEEALRDKVASAETAEEQKEAQQELDDWLLEQAEKTQIKKHEEEIAKVKEQGSKLKAEAKTMYDKQLEELDNYLLLEQERLNVKKENYGKTDEEITQIAKDNLLKREKDNETSLENFRVQFENEKPLLEQIFNDYGDLLLDGVKSTEADIMAYIEHIKAMASIDEDATPKGSHYGGASYIGSDGLYRLHEGERVLTKAQNKIYTQNITNHNTMDTLSLEHKLDKLIKTVSNITRQQQIINNMA